MAKSDFGNKQELQEYLAGLKQIDAQYKILNAEAKKLADVPGGAKNQVKQQLRDLQIQYDTHKEILASIKLATKELDDFEKTQQKIAKTSIKVTDELKKQTESIDAQEKRIKNLAEDFDEIDGLQNSITSNYGKQYGDVAAIQKKIDGTKGLISGISELIKHDSKVYGDQLDKILDIAEQYKGMPETFARLSKERKLGLISEKQMNQQLKRNQDEFEEMVSKLKITNAETEQLINLFKQLNEENDKFSKVTKAKSDFEEGAGALGDKVFSNAPPVIGDLYHGAREVRSAFQEGAIVTAATIAGFYALTKAFAYYKSFRTLQIDGNENDPNNIINLQRMYTANKQILDMNAQALELNVQRLGGFTKAFAIFDFQTKMLNLEQEFNKVSKTAFFGTGLGSTKYAADQLQLMGISGNEIVSTMSELSKTASSGIQDLGEEVAVFSKQTGVGADGLGNIINIIRRFDKKGGSDAFEIMQKSLSKSKEDGYNLTDITDQLANSTELAAEYGMTSYNTILKQIEATRELGGNFDKIGEAGKSMVVNYKDTIKKEMELSAMIGERVDLSSVMAKFNAGDREGAFAELKSMNLYEKTKNAAGVLGLNQLKGMLGGLPLTELMAPGFEKGPKGEGLKSNASFLKTFKDAAVTFEVNNAEINIGRESERKTMRGGEQDLIAAYYQDLFLQRNFIQGIGNTIDEFMDVEKASLLQAFNPFTTLDDIGKSRTLARWGDVKLFGTDNNDYQRPPTIDTTKNTSHGKTGSNIKPTSANKYLTDTTQPNVSSGRQIDYIRRIPNTQQEAIDVSKMQDAKLGELNSKNETSIQLLKSLRDLTAIMMDPERKEDFNVQLNMNGRQIHNVLIRSTKKLEGTQKGSGMSFATK